MSTRPLRFALPALLLLAACGNNDDPSGNAARATVTVCSGGLSSETSLRLQALISGSGGSLGGTVLTDIKGAIFDDSSMQGREKLEAYSKYLDCVRERGVAVYPDNAEEGVQVVQQTTDWRESRSSSYDWVGQYSRIYKNVSSREVTCKLRVRGILRNTLSDRVAKVGEINYHEFSLRPGRTKSITGDVGVQGFNSDTRVVSLDDDLSCWFS